jgi:hypothetical protein
MIQSKNQIILYAKGWYIQNYSWYDVRRIISFKSGIKEECISDVDIVDLVNHIISDMIQNVEPKYNLYRLLDSFYYKLKSESLTSSSYLDFILSNLKYYSCHLKNNLVLECPNPKILPLKNIH